MITGFIAMLTAVVGLAASRFIPVRQATAGPVGNRARPIDIRMVMAAVVTIVALAIALIALLGPDADAESRAWAYGAMGTILVFWLATGK